MVLIGIPCLQRLVTSSSYTHFLLSLCEWEVSARKALTDSQEALYPVRAALSVHLRQIDQELEKCRREKHSSAF
ncbi:unnamed protein product [Nezara viridula]|uniref:Uncharacterized protein n=1 Tax=Nezara viridula TaxID=85310 RepID=A0A9P0MXH0_NEZVI|nr:unnamed protein product [Nezara viridula]